RGENGLVARGRVEQAEFGGAGALLAQDVARAGVHAGQKALELVEGPAGLEVFDDGRLVAGRLDHADDVARGAAFAVVKDGDGKVGHGAGSSSCAGSMKR